MRKLSFLFMLMAFHYSFAQWTTFTPQVYRPVQPDYSILQRSLEKIEQRRNEANEQYSRLMMLLGEYGMQLNGDEQTLIWFDNYKKDIQKSFNSLSAIGCWGKARNYVVRKQGEIANDPELQARIKTAQEYRATVANMQGRSDMSQEEKRKWIINNPYCFVAVKNNDDKVIGGRLGSKAELEQQLREIEEQRLAVERQARIEAELEKTRLYNMSHPFDDYDYSSYYKVIDYPLYKQSRDNSDIVITRIALSSSETRVEMELTSYYAWCSIDYHTYIKPSSGSKLYLTSVDNIAISPSRVEFKNAGEKLKFALTFPALPSKAKSFTLSESVKDGWKFKNIGLSK